ncbi:lipopolysaccharide biosynthesis protein [Arthrobacter globiformis]|uniref:lipopolysaccharide biosynthesis protein n=1 Tax=Arthrobacter globiformis TaxID=1665 RepID=UPI00397A50E2
MNFSKGKPGGADPSGVGTDTADSRPAPPGEIARAGARGALWQGLAFAVGKAIVLVTTVVLARLLSPEQYGLVALALVLMAYAETVADAGVAQALVYLPRTRDAARAALLISVLMGGLLTAGAIISAPLIAAFFDRPDVAPLVRVLALSLLATALAAVPEALLRRELRFRQLTAATVTRACAAGSVTLVLAFAGYGAWSLAIGTLAGSAAYATACWILLREQLDWQIWRVRKQSLRESLGFGAPAAGSTLLARLIFDVDYLIIGRVLGASALGYYTLAFRLPELLIINVFFVLSTVMFPLYAQVRNDQGRLRSGYLKSVQLQSLYGLTAGVGLAVIAPVLVPVLFGGQWTDAVLPLVFLSLYAAARSLGAGANDLYKALGRPGLSIWISLVRLVILLPVLVLSTRWGIPGVACAQFAVAVLFAIGMQAVAAKVMRLQARQLLAAALPGLVCGVAVAVTGLAVRAIPLPGDVLSALAVILTCVGVVYAVLRWAFPSLHDELLQLVRHR